MMSNVNDCIYCKLLYQFCLYVTVLTLYIAVKYSYIADNDRISLRTC